VTAPLSSDAALLGEALLALALGAAAIVLLAAVACRGLESGWRRRAVWQTAALALLALIAFEVSGVAAGFGAMVHGVFSTEAPAASLPDASPAPRPGPLPESSPASPPLVDRAAPKLDHDPIAEAEALAEFAGAIEELRVLEAEGRPEPARIAAGPAGAPRALETNPDARLTRAVPASGGAAASPAAAARPRAGVWAGALWLAGALLLLARVAASRLMLSLYRWRRGESPSASLRGRVEALARRFGIRRAIALRASKRLSAPMTFGALRPALVVPADFESCFEHRHQDAMLAHELAHIAGWDALWRAFANLAAALLWWHPLAWWARRRLAIESEFAADEASAAVEEGPGALAESLVLLGGRLLRPLAGAPLSVEGVGFRSGLGRRVERLLRLEARPPAPEQRYSPTTIKTSSTASILKVPAALAIVAAAALGTVWARPQSIHDQLDEGDSAMTSSRLFPWRRSLAALVLSTTWSLAQEAAPPPGPEAVPAPAPAPVAGIGEERVPIAEPAPAAGAPVSVPGPQAEPAPAPPRAGARVRRPGRAVAGKAATPVAPVPGLPPAPADDVAEPPVAGAGAAGGAPGELPVAPGGAGVGVAPAPGVGAPNVPNPFDPGALPPGWPGYHVPSPGGFGQPSPLNQYSPYGQRTAIPAAPGQLGLDIVGLATALIDSQGEVEIGRLKLENAEQMRATAVIPESEARLARIQLETAIRKEALYRRMAEAALRASEQLLARLQEAKESLRMLQFSGQADGSAYLLADSQIAVAEGNVEMLRALLAESSSAGATPGARTGAAPAAATRAVRSSSSSRRRASPGEGDAAGGAERPPVVEMSLSNSHGLLQESKTILQPGQDLRESLAASVAAVAEASRAGVKVRLQFHGDTPAALVSDTIAALNALGFTKIELGQARSR
jgi:hypothetical protein